MKFPDAAEEPLKGGIESGKRCKKPSTSLQGPKKAIRLCILGILIPALLISVPLYLRYRVYDPQLYPMAVSDMRTIDGKISTTWCQGNVIHSNISFNAFLMKEKPKISPNLKHVQMTRHLVLDDDMKEYWGFYLLQGSKVIVSSCSSQPGASLIIIKGHRHLNECAYIGDDSSEESDELREIEEEKLAREKGHTVSPTSRIDMLKKHRPEVSFEVKDATQKNSTFNKLQNQEHEDETPLRTAKEMRELLNKLNDKRNTRAKGARVITETSEEREAHKQHHKTTDNEHRTRTVEFGKAQAGNVEFGTLQDDLIAVGATEEPVESSSEILASLIKKMRKLGPKGKKIIEMLQREAELSPDDPDNSTDSTTAPSATSAGPVSEERIESILRNRRDVIMKTALSIELNADDETENLAKEEGFVPDGHADHHQRLNQTTLNDRSDSEIWSSFSSSEEALLECPGLIMSLPLTPSRTCQRGKGDVQLREEFSPNTITFTVTANGYYFFVFSSENEVEKNYIRASFNLKKVVYDVSDPVAKCNGTEGKCTLPLDFLSNEQVVIELPADEGRNVGRNQEYILVSECQPRTSLYLLCILAVPFMILAFAFQ